MATDKKSKKRQEVLKQKLQKLQLLLTGAKQQKDDLQEIARFEREIAEVKREMQELK